MKAIRTILITLVLLISLSGYTQTNEPMYGDNTITVSITDSVSFKSIKKLLIESGYRVTESDSDIGYATTDYKTFKGTALYQSFQMSVTILMSNQTVVVYANYKFKDSLSPNTYTGIAECTKRQNVIKNLAFNELITFAKTIGDSLTYSVK